MKTRLLFVGDIKKCTKYSVVIDSVGKTMPIGHLEKKDKTIKENAVLIEVKPNHYLDLDKADSIISLLKVYFMPSKYCLKPDSIYKPYNALYENKTYIEESTIKGFNFIGIRDQDHISLKRLRLTQSLYNKCKNKRCVE